MRLLGGVTVITSNDPPQSVAHLLTNPITLLVARICVTAPFLEGGLVKLLDWQAANTEMAQTGLHPAWLFNLATVLTELGGSALIILNRNVWLGAGALGVFTVFATLLGHRFWDLTGAARITELNTFLEHATISAAFILVVVVSIRSRSVSIPKGTVNAP
jgi:transmembrane protein